jgi:hypothetical protein
MALAGAASAAVTPKRADSEAPLASQYDHFNEMIGTLGIVDGGYGDAHATRATYSGGGGNGYARGIFDVNWAAGDEVWYSAAFFLPEGFKASMQGQVAIMRWDDYGTHPEAADQGGIVINGGDHRARLVLNHLPEATQRELTGSFNLPEGRWFHLEVHQRLSPTGGLNEVYLDGERIVASHEPNIAPGRGISRMRYGIVAVGAGAQTRPLSLSFDQAVISTSQTGADPALARPGTDPAPRPTARRRSPRTRTARYTPRVRKCMGRALKRAARSGNADILVGAARRCVQKYAKRR